MTEQSFEKDNEERPEPREIGQSDFDLTGINHDNRDFQGEPDWRDLDHYFLD